MPKTKKEIDIKEFLALTELYCKENSPDHLSVDDALKWISKNYPEYKIVNDPVLKEAVIRLVRAWMLSFLMGGEKPEDVNINLFDKDVERTGAVINKSLQVSKTNLSSMYTNSSYSDIFISIEESYKELKRTVGTAGDNTDLWSGTSRNHVATYCIAHIISTVALLFKIWENDVS